MVGPGAQHGHGLRLEWGAVGAQASAADVTVVVDILSFSTTVTVAVARGTRVYPCPWDDDRAHALAAERDAVLAVGRLEATRDGVVVARSLSPSGLLVLDPVERLVLPSPNGSAIAAASTRPGSTVVIGCLRNATAVAAWLAPELAAGRTVTVVAAGERWPGDGSLRPAVEDQLGAGAILSSLRSLGHAQRCSPEAWTAAALFDAVRHRVEQVVADSVSGRELADRGFAADVDVAADLDASTAVPVLRDGAFSL